MIPDIPEDDNKPGVIVSILLKLQLLLILAAEISSLHIKFRFVQSVAYILVI